MPLTSAIQSAMAIRHEREKRQQRRMSKIRRESGVGSTCCSHISCNGGSVLNGSESGRHASLTGSERRASTLTNRTASLVPCMEEGEEGLLEPPKDKSESSLTTFHLGIVFILLGFIMIFSSMIPSSFVKADWSRMLGVGVAFIFIGLIMVMVNRIITAREEEELRKYVKQRLSRTRSGQAFVHRHSDPETGKCLTPGCAPGKSLPSPLSPQAVSLKPDNLPPSAMKGASGEKPPRSPKDKVTFAQFESTATDSIDIGDNQKLVVGETETLSLSVGEHVNPACDSIIESERLSSTGAQCEISDLPRVNIESPSSDKEEPPDPSLSVLTIGPPSPACETKGLLSDSEKEDVSEKLYN